ncbi:hypothetical protein SERLADRAFT_443064 [Serpula lacrymans var. lacrymans S7.9]|uniref:Uncharacterized protein n=1 Tax=Serpula lacrymans var. lacrymans (strain S7.9) TaxID=578457 RepID=F8PBF4_SERL9|nr:uncharacterized protein SERLADRAFT_443064 [Serpula lacrymans var. lacrymans S7.9]EGO19594.1 hypothetical protein SERLADRAFT_443064 [Serpula lacrymans var. lacrymans S7.9]
MSDSIRTGNLRHKASISNSSIRSTPSVPEIWNPTLAPEKDAAMSQRYAISLSVLSNSVPNTSSAYSRPVDNPRSFQPPTSASRPGIIRNTSIDEGRRIPQQNSRSQNKNDIPRSWLSSYVPGRLQPKDIRPVYARQQGPTHTYREEPESEDELKEVARRKRRIKGAKRKGVHTKPDVKNRSDVCVEVIETERMT